MHELLLTRRNFLRASGIIVSAAACDSLPIGQQQEEFEIKPEIPGISDLDFPLSGDMYLIFGPHYKGKDPGVLYAIDLTSKDPDAKIVAAHFGTVIKASDYMVEIDVGEGYSLEYVHVGNIRVKVGDEVHRTKTILGEMTFNAPKDGKSDSDHLHLHFGIKRYGQPIDIDGESLFGWVVRKGKNPGDGTMSKEDKHAYDNRIVTASFELNEKNRLIHPRFAQPGAAR